MARLKYSPDSKELFNGNSGFTFSKSPGLPACRLNPKARHASSPSQFNVRNCMQSAIAAWRAFSSAERLNWQNWVNYLPQLQRHDETKFLNAYDNFIKRQFYFNIASFPAVSILNEPVLTTYIEDPFSAELREDSEKIFIDFIFDRSDNSLDCYCSLNLPSSVAVNVNRSRARYSFCIRNLTQSVDVTSLFQNRFNRLPTPNDSVFLQVIEAGRDNGQFFFPIISKISYYIPVTHRIYLASTHTGAISLYILQPIRFLQLFQSFYFPGGKLKSLMIMAQPTNVSDVDITCEVWSQSSNRPISLLFSSSNFIRVFHDMAPINSFLFENDLNENSYLFKIYIVNYRTLDPTGQPSIITSNLDEYANGFMSAFVVDRYYDYPSLDFVGYFDYES